MFLVQLPIAKRFVPGETDSCRCFVNENAAREGGDQADGGEDVREAGAPNEFADTGAARRS